MTLTIDINRRAPQWTGLADADELVCRAAEAALAWCGLSDVETELSVLLTDDDDMATINGQWRGKEKPTNVLSFPAMALAPGDRPGPLLGDIILSWSTIMEEAESGGKTGASHLFHLVVHGMLHLLGHDHIVDTEAEMMESIEKSILAAHGYSDPYALPQE